MLSHGTRGNLGESFTLVGPRRKILTARRNARNFSLVQTSLPISRYHVVFEVPSYPFIQGQPKSQSKKDHTLPNRSQNCELIKVNETYARKLRVFSVLNVGFFKMNTSITIHMQSFSQMNSSKYLSYLLLYEKTFQDKVSLSQKLH